MHVATLKAETGVGSIACVVNGESDDYRHWGCAQGGVAQASKIEDKPPRMMAVGEADTRVATKSNPSNQSWFPLESNCLSPSFETT